MFLLTTAALVPLIGAVLVFFLRGGGARIVALLASLVSLVIAIYIAMGFEPGAGMQFTEQVQWIPPLGAYYALGVDGIGLSMVLLTTILTPLVILYSGTQVYDSKRFAEHTYLALVLAVEGLSLYVFTATDVLLFYLFFEATLIPMFFLIGGFGGESRRYAAIKFLLYMLASGLIMLAAVIGVYGVSNTDGNGTFLLEDLQAFAVDSAAAKWLFWGFMIAFIVKAPMVPFHTWLPDAAENTTPGAAVMMVSVMDKIGTFGMLRFALVLFPEASRWATPVLIFLAVVSIIWGALAAIAQDNLMRLVAYTSVSHFGFIVLGIFAMNNTSVASAALYMFNHGISTAALFLVVGFLIKRRGTADIAAFGGVQRVAPLLAGFLLISGLSALSLPGLAPFVSEFGVIAGAWQNHKWAAGISAIAMVLAATYVMRMYKLVATNEPREEVRAEVHELSQGERWVIAPIIALLFLFGLYPAPLTNLINPDAENLVTFMDQVAPVQTAPASLAADGEGATAWNADALLKGGEQL